MLDVDVIQVKNLSEWKSQLADKNKEIKEENKRFVFRNISAYFRHSGGDNDIHTIQPAHRTVTLKPFIILCRLQTKIEDLEHLMNDEVTDINEAIRTINNLQV